MQKQTKSKLITLGVMIGIVSICFYNTPIMDTNSIDPYFTLTMKATNHFWADYANLIKQQIAKIGISLNLVIVEWPTQVGLYFYDYELSHSFIPTLDLSADLRGVYSEDGVMNCYEYSTDSDYNETLGTGVNEWYLQEAAKMLPLYSQKKIQHFRDWQEYFMDDLLLCIPTFASKKYQANWNNLEGYNITKDILQSWGKMSWDGSHIGQQSPTELVVGDYFAVDNLNPLFQVDSTGRTFIKNAILESLLWVDPNRSIWPHLASDWTQINDTVVRMTIREGIKWQSDIDDNFTNEYLDARDVYFTYYCWKNVSNSGGMYDFLEKMILVDDYTLDFYFQNKTSMEEGNYNNNYLDLFTRKILPEHYLNQTQLADGITPDINHISWSIFAEHLFGTGLFELGTHTPLEELVLPVYSECWRLNNTIISDSKLNWENRFGDFNSNLNQIRIKYILDKYIEIIEFEAGSIDIIKNLDSDDLNSGLINSLINYDIQSEIDQNFGALTFRINPLRSVIGNPNPKPGYDDMTIGLSIRKAIAYAIDLDEINAVIHNNELDRLYYPFTPEDSIWANPNIIKYDHNLSKARELMGIIPDTTSNTKIDWIYPFSGAIIFFGFALLYRRRSKKR